MLRLCWIGAIGSSFSARVVTPNHVATISQTSIMPAIAPPTNRQDYVVLNRIGISYMRTGRFNHAISVFRLLLGGLADQESATSRPTNSRPSLSACDIGLNIRQTEEIELNTNGSKKLQEGYDHNTIVLYTRPFCFSDSSASGALFEDDPRMIRESPLVTTIAGIVLFNLGLSYHLRAMSPTFHRPVATNRDTNRRQAQLIYSNAKQVLCRQDMEAINSAQRRILLAVCNNRAHLSFHFFDISSTKSELSDLRYLLCLENDGEGYQEANDEQNSVQFIFNAMSHNVLAHTSPAA